MSQCLGVTGFTGAAAWGMVRAESWTVSLCSGETTQ